MTASADSELDQLCINTIRTLSIDAIQAANSGHPGTPMAMAPVAYELWQRFLRFDPEDPIWPNRDRFVLSAGHASMLLYSLLHLARVKAVDPDYETLGELSVKLDDIEHFRQLDSKAAGHPEYRWTSGVETTTGPLGQGVATSVGMAIAGQWLAAHFNRPGFEMFDFDVYVLAGDGDLMEGVSYEAASIAGHLRLSNLCWIYDNNRITIDGSTALTFSDDVATRFIGQGWNVTRVGDANDLELLDRAFETFKREDERPTLIVVDSHIGYGAPDVQDTAAAHGEPLGEEEVRAREAQLRLARGRAVPDSRRRRRALRGGRRRPRAGAARGLGAALRALPRRAPRARRPTSSGCSGASCPRAGTATFPSFPADEKGSGDPHRRPGQALNAVAAQRALAGRRRGRPHRLHQRRPDLRGGGRLLGRRPRRPLPPLRDPRARHGGRA